MASRDDSVHSGRHDDEVKVLTTQVSFLEEEVAALRSRLADSPRQTHLLEQRLREAESNLASITGQNERLAGTLREARDQIIALKEEVDRLAQPPSGFGVFLQATEDGTADVFTGGRKMRVSVSPSVELEELRPGQEVVLNEALNVVIAQGYETVGEVVMLKEVLEDGERALVISHADEERIARLAEPLLRPHAAGRRLAAARAPVWLRLRADPQGRGRRADTGGSPGHLLLRDRRSRTADRADPGRDRAAVPARRPVPRAPAAAAEGRAAVRAAWLRQDADRQGGRELAGQAGGGARCAGRGRVGQPEPTDSARRARSGAASSSTSRARSC